MSSRTSMNFPGFLNSLPEAMTAVATSLTDVCTTNARVYQAMISNTTAGALTFLLQDKQATPGQLIPTVSIAANTAYVIAWPEGQHAASGLSAQGSGAGLQMSLVGRYK